jgi:hypothetical protein
MGIGEKIIEIWPFLFQGRNYKNVWNWITAFLKQGMYSDYQIIA